MLLEWLIAFIIVFSALGVIMLKKPVHACLSFLLTLLGLASYYFLLSADFIGVMQILVYAGAILVLFIFVIVLFQDAHQQIVNVKPQSSAWLIGVAALTLGVSSILFGLQFSGEFALGEVSDSFGTVQTLGLALYRDYFFPFEAIVLMFLIALIGAVYLAKKEIA